MAFNAGPAPVDTLVPNSLLLMVIAQDFTPVGKRVNLGEMKFHFTTNGTFTT